MKKAIPKKKKKRKRRHVSSGFAAGASLDVDVDTLIVAQLAVTEPNANMGPKDAGTFMRTPHRLTQ